MLSGGPTPLWAQLRTFKHIKISQALHCPDYCLNIICFYIALSASFTHFSSKIHQWWFFFPLEGIQGKVSKYLYLSRNDIELPSRDWTLPVWDFLTHILAVQAATYRTGHRYTHILHNLMSTLSLLPSYSYSLSALTRIYSVFREMHGWILMCINVSVKTGPMIAQSICHIHHGKSTLLISITSMPSDGQMVHKSHPRSQTECSHKRMWTPYLDDTDINSGHPVLCNDF